MHPDTRHIALHMRDFGLRVLGRACYDVTFSEMMRPNAHAMAVGHAAHGAEIVLKARIAEEHPLLIFNDLPKSSTVPGVGQLTAKELFEYGRSIDYFDLPERLWATTGVRIADVDHFRRFGRLRNGIIHFAVPTTDLPGAVLRFLFGVVEPLIDQFWQMSIVHFATEWDDATPEYLPRQLEHHGVLIDDRLRAILKGDG